MKSVQAFLLYIVAAAGFYGAVVTAEESTRALRIGIVAPLSGPMSSVGNSIRSAILYAAQTERIPPILKFEDDQFQPKLTVSATRALLINNDIDVLVIFGSPTCLSVVDELERKKIPTLCLSIHEGVTKNKHYIFKLFPSSLDMAKSLVEEVRKRAYSRISVVSSQTDGLLAVSNNFISHLPRTKFVSHDEISPVETDLSPYATKVLKSKPDSILVMLLPHQFGPFVSKLVQQGFTGGIFNAVSLANSSVMKHVKQAIPEALRPNVWYSFFDASRAQALVSKIEKASNTELDAEGVLGYEAIRLLSRVQSPVNIAEQLQKLESVPSALGTIYREGQNFVVPVAINAIQ